MKRTLIVKLWALGDIVMATPLISTLHQNFPGIEIDWIADASHAEILRGHPGLTHVDALPTGTWRKMLRCGDLLSWSREAARLHQRYRSRGYDAVINCHPDKSWTRVLCPAPIRVGLYSTSTASWNQIFYTHSIVRPSKPPIHNTEHYLLAAEALGCTSLDTTMSIGRMKTEDEYLRNFLHEYSLSPDRPTVVIAPRTTAENRCWEPERYAQLADRLRQNDQAQIILTVSAKEIDAAAKIQEFARYPIAISAGTALGEYAALIRRADLVVSGDTSAMHIAAAVGTPYLALFGPTPIHERAPLVGIGKALAHPLPCAPCDSPRCSNPIFRECMKLHSVDEIVDAAQSLLALSARHR